MLPFISDGGKSIPCTARKRFEMYSKRKKKNPSVQHQHEDKNEYTMTLWKYKKKSDPIWKICSDELSEQLELANLRGRKTCWVGEGRVDIISMTIITPSGDVVDLMRESCPLKQYIATNTARVKYSFSLKASAVIQRAIISGKPTATTEGFILNLLELTATENTTDELYSLQLVSPQVKTSTESDHCQFPTLNENHPISWCGSVNNYIETAIQLKTSSTIRKQQLWNFERTIKRTRKIFLAQEVRVRNLITVEQDRCYNAMIEMKNSSAERIELNALRLERLATLEQQRRHKLEKQRLREKELTVIFIEQLRTIIYSALYLIHLLRFDELICREVLYRRMYINRSSTFISEFHMMEKKGHHIILKSIRLIKRKAVEHEQPKLELQLLERQHRNDLAVSEYTERSVILSELVDVVAAEKTRENEVIKQRLEERRLLSERKDKERLQEVIAEERVRRANELSEATSFREVQHLAAVHLEETELIILQRLRKARAAVREIHYREIAVVEDLELTERQTNVLEMMASKIRIETLWDYSYEEAIRPITISSSSSLEYVIGQSSVGVMSGILIKRRKKNTSIADSPIISSFIQLTVTSSHSSLEECCENFQFSFTEIKRSKGRTVRTEALMLLDRSQKSDVTLFYKGDKLIAKTTESNLSIEYGIVFNKNSLRVEFNNLKDSKEFMNSTAEQQQQHQSEENTSSEVGIAIRDIEDVLNSISYESIADVVFPNSSDELYLTISITLHTVLNASGILIPFTTAYQLPILISKPLISFLYSPATVEYCIDPKAAQEVREDGSIRDGCQLFRAVSVPGGYQPTNRQRDFTGAILSVTYVAIPQSGLEFVYIHQTTDVVQSSESSNVFIITDDLGDKAFATQTDASPKSNTVNWSLDSGVWSESNLLTFLKSIIYQSNALRPERPKRELLFTITLGKVVFPVVISIRLLFADDPTFWCLNQNLQPAPYSIFGGIDKNTTPRGIFQSLFDSLPTTFLTPHIIIQNQHGVQKFCGGYFQAEIISGFSQGDRLLADIKLCPGSEMDQTKKGIKINFPEIVELAAVQKVIQSLGFIGVLGKRKNSIYRKHVSIELLLLESNRRGEVSTAQIQIRIYPPVVSSGLNNLLHYTEGTQWKKITGLDVCNNKTDFAFFEGGRLEIRVSPSMLEECDELILNSQVAANVRLKQISNTGKYLISIRGGVNGTDEHIPLAWYIPPERGKSLIIHLTNPLLKHQCDFKISLQGGSQSEFVGDSRRGIRPKFHLKQLKLLLGIVYYKCSSSDPRILQKYIEVEVLDGTGVVSLAAVELNIIPVNNPTEIILRSSKIIYRQGVIRLAPKATLHDVDTSQTEQGALLAAEILTGSVHDVLSLKELSETESDQLLRVDAKTIFVEGPEGDKQIIATYAYTSFPYSAITVNLKVGVPLSTCALVLRMMTYENCQIPCKSGQRMSTIRFNAGDGVVDTRVRILIDLLPPVLWAPSCSKKVNFYERLGSIFVNTKISCGTAVSSNSIPGAKIQAEIITNYFPGQDRLFVSESPHFTINKDGDNNKYFIFLNAIEPQEKASQPIAILLLPDANNGILEIKFLETTKARSQAIVKLLFVFLKGICYDNVCDSPDTSLSRVVSIKLILQSYNGVNTAPEIGIVDTSISMLVTKNKTQITPKNLIVKTTAFDTHDLVFPFSECEVIDPDNDVFHDPYSFIVFELKAVAGSQDKPSRSDVLYISECPEEGMTIHPHNDSEIPHLFANESEDDVSLGDSIGSSFSSISKTEIRATCNVVRYHSRHVATVRDSSVDGVSQGLHISLKDCPLEVVRLLVQSVYFKSSTSRHRHCKFSLTVSIKGDESPSPPTKSRITLHVFYPSFESQVGFHESLCGYTQVMGGSGSQCLFPQIMLNTTVHSSIQGLVISIKFCGEATPLEGSQYNSRRNHHRMSISSCSSNIHATDLDEKCDLSKPQFDLISLSSNQFKTDDGGMVFLGKDKVASIEDISSHENSDGSHGLRITISRSPRITSVIVQDLLRAFQYESVGGDEVCKRLHILLSIRAAEQTRSKSSSELSYYTTTESLLLIYRPVRILKSNRSRKSFACTRSRNSTRRVNINNETAVSMLETDLREYD